jgi:hypothetical protein
MMNVGADVAKNRAAASDAVTERAFLDNEKGRRPDATIAHR